MSRDIVIEHSKHRFNVKTDPLHTILFPLRTIQLYQAHYFPDNFPEAARLYSQRMTQMQAMQAPSQMQPDSDDEDEFRSAIEDVGFLSDLGPGALDVPVAEKGGSDVEFDDDLDFANLMNVDFDAAAAAAIANKAPMVTKTPVKSQPTKRPVPLTPSFDDFDLGGAGDLDALLDGDVVMADPGTVDPGLSSAVQAFIAEGGGVRTKQEIDARFGGEHGLDAVGKVLTSVGLKATTGFCGYLTFRFLSSRIRSLPIKTVTGSTSCNKSLSISLQNLCQLSTKYNCDAVNPRILSRGEVVQVCTQRLDSIDEILESNLFIRRMSSVVCGMSGSANRRQLQDAN